eukprot:22822_6
MCVYIYIVYIQICVYIYKFTYRYTAQHADIPPLSRHCGSVKALWSTAQRSQSLNTPSLNRFAPGTHQKKSKIEKIKIS